MVRQTSTVIVTCLDACVQPIAADQLTARDVHIMCDTGKQASPATLPGVDCIQGRFTAESRSAITHVQMNVFDASTCSSWRWHVKLLGVPDHACMGYVDTIGEAATLIGAASQDEHCPISMVST